MPHITLLHTPQKHRCHIDEGLRHAIINTSWTLATPLPPPRLSDKICRHGTLPLHYLPPRRLLHYRDGHSLRLEYAMSLRIEGPPGCATYAGVWAIRHVIATPPFIIYRHMPNTIAENNAWNGTPPRLRAGSSAFNRYHGIDIIIEPLLPSRLSRLFFSLPFSSCRHMLKDMAPHAHTATAARPPFQAQRSVHYFASPLCPSIRVCLFTPSFLPPIG